MQATKAFCFVLVLLVQAVLVPHAGARPPQFGGPGNAPVLEADVRHEGGPGLLPVDRAYVEVGTNKYAFMVPAGLRLDVSQPNGVVLRNDDYSCFLTFRILGPLPLEAQELTPDAAKAILLREHPGAKIDVESSRVADHHSGPAFDVQWTGSAGQLQSARVVFIPYHGSVLEFEVVCRADNFTAGQQKLHIVLLSFRASGPDGKLHIPPLPDKI